MIHTNPSTVSGVSSTMGLAQSVLAGQRARAADPSGSAAGSDQFTSSPELSDELQASPGSVFRGTDGNDRIRVKKSRDGYVVVNMNGTTQRFSQEQARSLVIDGGAGNDRITLSHKVQQDLGLRGGDGNDVIRGGAGKDEIHGGSGNDRVWGGAGADTIYGGTGDDRIRGNRGPDTIYGGPGNDQIWGGHGKDTIYGGPGDDRIHGGPGHDTIYGGNPPCPPPPCPPPHPPCPPPKPDPQPIPCDPPAPRPWYGGFVAWFAGWFSW